MSKIGLIIGREYITRVRKKSFIVMTILGPLLVGGFVGAAIWLGTKDDTMNKVLVSDEGGLFNGRMESTAKIKFTFEPRSISENEFVKKEEYAKYNLLLVINKNVIEKSACQLYYRKMPSSRVENHIVTQVNTAIEKFKVEDKKIQPEVYEYIKSTHVQLALIEAGAKDDGKSRYLGVLGFVFALFIYLFIFL
ncbi:MAG: ABC transporter permease, partial [Flavobacteriales bacterium]